jgi:hypothetical protein
VLIQPTGQLLTVKSARRHGEHQAFLVIDWGVNLIAIQHQEDFHRRVPNPFVPVDEGVIRHEAEAQGGGLVNKRRVEVGTIERGAGLRQGRFEQPDVADATGSARGEKETPMEFDDLTQREVPHQAKRRYRSAFLRSTRSAAL